MQFLFDHGHYPPNLEQIADLDRAAERLAVKLKSLKPDKLKISEYNKRYLSLHYASLDGYLRKCVWILAWAFSDPNIPLEEQIFLEYGGGTGFLSLLAGEAGVAQVLYNDIYPVSCEDAGTLAENLNVKVDRYVPGDIDEVVLDFKNHQTSCTSIASNDVLEHVYRPYTLLERMANLSNGSLTLAMASTANGKNPRILYQHKKIHHRHEFKERIPEAGHKQIDTTRAFLDLRKDIIREFCQGISESEISRLAELTRGLRKDDIHTSVERYKRDRQLPKLIQHPSNTCDPYTGNWAEHLLDFQKLTSVLKREGFEARIEAGYYSNQSSISKRWVGAILNAWITSLKSWGLFIAPFFLLFGQRRSGLNKKER